VSDRDTLDLVLEHTVHPFDGRGPSAPATVLRTGEWMTLGGNCDTTTCKTAYWWANDEVRATTRVRAGRHRPADRADDRTRHLQGAELTATSSERAP